MGIGGKICLHVSLFRSTPHNISTGCVFDLISTEFCQIIPREVCYQLKKKDQYINRWKTCPNKASGEKMHLFWYMRQHSSISYRPNCPKKREFITTYWVGYNAKYLREMKGFGCATTNCAKQWQCVKYGRNTVQHFRDCTRAELILKKA
jgi:hypothetical protein